VLGLVGVLGVDAGVVVVVVVLDDALSLDEVLFSVFGDESAFSDFSDFPDASELSDFSDFSALPALSDFPPSDFGADPLSPFG